jgi:WD40 repeat protein
VHSKTIRSIKFSPNGKFLASASFDGTIGIWILVDGKYDSLQILEGHDNEVKCVAWSPDN